MIEIQGLEFTYPRYTVLSGLSLSVAAGEAVGLLGPLHSGKSTLVKILATLVPPTGGAVTIAGHDLRREPAAVRAAVGYEPNYFASYEDMSVREYLDFYAR